MNLSKTKHDGGKVSSSTSIWSFKKFMRSAFIFERKEDNELDSSDNNDNYDKRHTSNAINNRKKKNEEIHEKHNNISIDAMLKVFNIHLFYSKKNNVSLCSILLIMK